MGKLAAILDGQTEQLSIDDYLALDRDDSPPENTAAVGKGASGPTIGADPDVIMADLDPQGNASHPEKGTETHIDGNCPYVVKCETRRRRLSTYRQFAACHWVTWQDVGGCPIFQNGGNEHA